MMAAGFFAGAATMLAQGKRGYFAGAAMSAVAILLLYAPTAGIITFHSHEVFGLTLLVATVVPPAWLLGYWTAGERQVYGRSFLQASIWTTLLLWLLPSAALVNTGGEWTILSNQSPLLFLPMLIPVTMIANALWVFARYGDGTGFPYDPPKKLVMQGIYQYISNPTQLAICLAMGWWGLLLHSYIVMACAPIAALLFVVFKDVCNGSSNLCGDDPEWRGYHQRVPRWFPQIRRKG
jgi:protein-S-isoprenylcysteine O-methyltransferase Ste14